MELGRRLATGATADLYVLDAERVGKRFGPGTPLHLVKREARYTERAASTGLRVPRVLEVTRLDGRPVIVLERIDGPTMEDAVLARPWRLFHAARQLADLHVELHESKADIGRSLREKLREDIVSGDLDDQHQAWILERLHDLPTGDSFLHGDFHPGNVVLGADDPVVIDWRDASVGHPAADVARTSILLRFGGSDDGWLVGVLRAVFRRVYLRRYARRTGVSRDLVRRWELPVAAARLSEAVPEATLLRLFVVRRLAGTREAWASRLETQ